MEDSLKKVKEDTLTFLKTLDSPLYLYRQESSPVTLQLEKAKAPQQAIKQQEAVPVEKKQEIAPPLEIKQEIKPVHTPLLQAAPAEEKPVKAELPIFGRTKPHNLEVTLTSSKKLLNDPMEDIKKAIETIMPSFHLNFAIPSDEKAKHAKNNFRFTDFMPEVPLFALPGKTFSFLENVAKAINSQFFPSKVIDLSKIEKESLIDELLKSPKLKCILIPDSVLFSSKALLKHYQEFPSKKEYYLGKTPLLLLPDPSIYLKDPSLKRLLWNLICDTLTPLRK